MAEGTRARVEDRSHANMESRMGSMEQQITGLQELVRGLLYQFTEVMNRVNGRNQDYQVPTRVTKIEFPRFTPSDVNGWISKCERFFQLDGTPEDSKVPVASLALDDAAYKWFQNFEKGTLGRVAWEGFVEVIKVRFGTLFDDPLEELMKLKHIGSLAEFQEKFEGLVYRCNFSEEQKLSAYLGALKPKVAVTVKLFKPQTLIDAIRLAKLQELNIGINQKIIPSSYNKPVHSHNQFVPLPKSDPGIWLLLKPEVKNWKGTNDKNLLRDQKGILGKLALRFHQKLTPEEVEDHKSKNLCFFCHDKFGPGHECAQRKKMQLYLMITDEDEEASKQPNEP